MVNHIFVPWFKVLTHDETTQRENTSFNETNVNETSYLRWVDDTGEVWPSEGRPKRQIQ